ncbi:MAG: AI-2E family transporter [Anaerolineae bacterium]|nr:AI-2E family transporter [Anaerolineae bacterium]
MSKTGGRLDLGAPRPSRRWSPFTKQIVLIAILVGAVWLIFRFSQVLAPTVIACLLAYVFSPLVTYLQQRAHIPRALGILLCYLLVLGIISLLPILVVPSLVEQAQALDVDMEKILLTVSGWFGRQEVVLFGFPVDIRSLYNQMGDALRGLFSPAATGAVSLVVNVASGLLWTIYVLVVSFYLLLDAPRLRGYFAELLPPYHREELLRLVDDVDRIWRSFFRGQLVLSLTIGVVVTVVTAALGLRNALALGVVAGVLEFLPNIGPAVAATPAVLLAFFQGSSYLPLSNWAFALVVIGAYMVIQQVENNYLMPRILGRSVRLHPLVVIVGIVLGANLAGILGIFLAAPTLATLRIVLRYAYRKLLDMEPFGEGLAPILEEELIPRRALVGGELVEAILFDLDGTLMETDRAVAGEEAEEAGGARRSLGMRLWRVADQAHKALDRVGLDDEADRLRQWVGERVPILPDITEIPLVEGMREALQALARRYRLGLLTTRPRREVIRWLEHHGLMDTFAVVTTNDDVRHRKPDPEGVLRSAEKLNLPPNRCLVVGDTPDDVEAAQRAGALSAAVLTGLGSEEDLIGADLQVRSVAELPQILL